MSNPLVDVLSPRVRKYLYAVLFVAALVFSIYQASDGDWFEFAGALLASLLGLVAASNTPANGGNAPPKPGPVRRQGGRW